MNTYFSDTKDNLIKILIFISSICLPTLFFAQADVSEIRKAYYDIAERIAACGKDGYTCSLYQNTLSKNVNGTSWAGVGTYHADIDFWYAADESGEGYELKKVIIKSQHSDRTYSREFLFIEEKLAFYYVVSNDNAIKKRYYFKDDQLIKYMEDSEVKSLKDSSDISYTIEESKSILALFKAALGVGE